MKREINTKKVKDLLSKNNLTQKSFASKIGMQEANLSKALSGERLIPMDYVFAIANFFKVKPISLTISNDTKQKAS